MLNLFYITNNPEIARIADRYGVDRVWIDLEVLGKQERQGGMNTVKSNHCVGDIPKVKRVLSKSEVLVRVNPWNEHSLSEIDQVIRAGADIVMLPMWKSRDEVCRFLSAVNGRVKTMLLLETKEAAECVDSVLDLPFDEIHIGLNDLHISYGMRFLFEPLANGMVDDLCARIAKSGKPYGFGGIARLGEGLVPSEMVIQEHYRLNSTRAILSRSFCDAYKLQDIRLIDELFNLNMKKIRDYETSCLQKTKRDLDLNHLKVIDRVHAIVADEVIPATR